MLENSAYRCNCPSCQGIESARTTKLHSLMRCFLSTLDARQQCLYVGLEAIKRGQGSERLLAQITDLSEQAILVGQRELRQETLAEPRKTSKVNSSTTNLISGLGGPLVNSKLLNVPVDVNQVKCKFPYR